MNNIERIASALEGIASNHGQLDPLLFVVPFFSALLGAFSSAWLFHKLALRREMAQRRQERTQSMIDQFFSRDFISHRASMYETWSKISKGKIMMRDLALGFVFPIDKDDDDYVGDEYHGFTEHEHITLFLGYIDRVAFDISEELVEIPALRKALSYEFTWHLDLLQSLTSECRKIAQEKSTNTPSFCESTDRVLDGLKLRGPRS